MTDDDIKFSYNINLPFKNILIERDISAFTPTCNIEVKNNVENTEFIDSVLLKQITSILDTYHTKQLSDVLLFLTDRELFLKQNIVKFETPKLTAPPPLIIQEIKNTIQEIKTPIQNLVVQEIKTPIQEIKTPIQEIKTPIQNSVVQEIKNPVIQEIQNPVIQEIKTPIQEIKTTIQEIKTPIQNSVIQEIQNPVQEASNINIEKTVKFNIPDEPTLQPVLPSFNDDDDFDPMSNFTWNNSTFDDTDDIPPQEKMKEKIRRVKIIENYAEFDGFEDEIAVVLVPPGQFRGIINKKFVENGYVFEDIAGKSNNKLVVTNNYPGTTTKKIRYVIFRIPKETALSGISKNDKIRDLIEKYYSEYKEPTGEYINIFNN